MLYYENLTERIGMRTLSRPVACSWGPGRVDVFWKGAAGELMHSWWVDEGERSLWRAERLASSSALASDPAVCSWGDRRIDLFWRESSGSIRHKWYDGVRWDSEETFPAQMTSAPAACSWGTGRIDLFWRHIDGTLRHRSFNAGRWSEESLGDRIDGDPNVCSWGPNRIDVFWRRSSDRSLQHKWFDGHWAETESLGGDFDGPPSTCSWAPNQIDVFVRKNSSQLWHCWFDVYWHEWRRREGEIYTDPGVSSWGDGFLDIFVAGRVGRETNHLYHGIYRGRPVATRSGQVNTLWGWLRSYSAPDKVAKLINAFPCGSMDYGSCSGAMISPHLFMTAAHCGGSGKVVKIQFYRIDQFHDAPDDNAQAFSQDYVARALPWTDFGGGNPAYEGAKGDTVLYWLEDGVDGVAPGVKYGYQVLTRKDINVGKGYSFWTNPAGRLDRTLLFSEGPILGTDDSNLPFYGIATHFGLYSNPGSSGSSVIVPESLGTPKSLHPVVGVTSQAGIDSSERTTADTISLLTEYDADRNKILDSIEYDWLSTRPLLPFYFIDFFSYLDRSHWKVLDNSSGYWKPELGLSDRPLAGVNWSLTDVPLLIGKTTRTGDDRHDDGLWHQYARFEANKLYRISLVAKGTPGSQYPGGACYLKFISDSSGDEKFFNFSPTSDGARINGKVVLGPHRDYRLIVGARQGSRVRIETIAISQEDQFFGFDTQDERLSWEYRESCRPTSWGTRGKENFGGLIIGPGSMQNRHVGFVTNTNYTIRISVKHKRQTRLEGTCFMKIASFAGETVGEHQWSFSSPGETRAETLEFNTGPGDPKFLIFGTESSITFVVSDIKISSV